MRILFDHGTPAPLRRILRNHEVATAYELGWAELANGALLSAAEAEFDALITTDQSLRYRQNLVDRKLAILVHDKLASNPSSYRGDYGCNRCFESRGFC